MWVRRERPERERRPAPAQVLRQEPGPELRTNLQAQARAFAHQR